jgi:DNA-binding CsgD family transcriptional regulator
MTDDAFHAGMLDNLYAGSLDDGAWSAGLLSIADRFQASAAVLLAFNPTDGAVLRDENHRFDPAAVDEYRQHWTFLDPRRIAFIDTPLGMPVTERTLGIPDWPRSALLNEYLLRVDAPHFMPAWLNKSPTKAVALSLQGTRKRGPFEKADLAAYRQLLPHVRRALQLRDRLADAEIHLASLAQDYEQIRYGVMLLSGTGVVIEMNLAMRQLLRGERGIRVNTSGGLWLREPAGKELRAMLAGTLPRSLPTGLLHIQRERRQPLSLTVTPLGPVREPWFGEAPRWLVAVFDPEKKLLFSRDRLALDLGLTAREADVVMLLANGCGLTAIAVKLQVSVHTVRTHLKSAFRKTGSGTQADLVRRVLTGPSLLGNWPLS